MLNFDFGGDNMGKAARDLTFLILFSIVFSGSIPIIVLFTSLDGSSLISPREPEIRIEMPTTASVDVSPGNDGIIDLAGRVYCEMPPGSPPNQYCLVSLTADAEGWPVSTTNSLTFSTQTTVQDIQVIVRAPPGTTAGNSYRLLVSGRWRYSPGTLGGSIEPSWTRITVNPYGLLIFSAERSKITAPVGSWGRVEIQLKNEGNTNDNVTISYLCGSNIEIKLGIELATQVNEDSFIVFPVSVKQKSGRGQSNVISILAKGIHPGNRSSCEIILNLKTSTSPKGIITSPLIIGSISIIILILIPIIIAIIKLVRKKHRKKILKLSKV